MVRLVANIVDQFLKFQSFAEQLTKETQELKVKIETHKRENRRLVLLIDQHKDDTARITVRLAGTEKQRDDALEALVLQQEIAEKLERERKRNKKELGALLQTNKNIIRQREEAQRVVVHLRSLISGQTHHMEHIVRSLSKAPELSEYMDDGLEELPEESDDRRSLASPEPKDGRLTTSRSLASLRKASRRMNRRSFSPAGSIDGGSKAADGEKVTPEMERRFFGSPAADKRKRLSDLSLFDVADRHLRDKTEAIANIIRNISEQCAAAVEGLQLAHNAEQEDELEAMTKQSEHLIAPSEDGLHSIHTAATSEIDEGVSDAGYTDPRTPGSLATEYRNSSIPPTPDLEHHRSSTSMSINSLSTTTDRGSLPYPSYGHHHHSQVSSGAGPAPKIVEGDDESERSSQAGVFEVGGLQKGLSGGDVVRAQTGRLVSSDGF